MKHRITSEQSNWNHGALVRGRLVWVEVKAAGINRRGNDPQGRAARSLEAGQFPLGSTKG
jgi:hypothetical protein